MRKVIFICDACRKEITGEYFICQHRKKGSQQHLGAAITICKNCFSHLEKEWR